MTTNTEISQRDWEHYVQYRDEMVRLRFSNEPNADALFMAAKQSCYPYLEKYGMELEERYESNCDEKGREYSSF